MIVRLDKQQQPAIRRQLLKDVVWAITNDTLRRLQREGKTSLAPVEVFLSARQFCDTVLGLSDIDEGIDYEIDDLEDEAGETDAMLVTMLATALFQAQSKLNSAFDSKPIILHVYERWNDHELFFPLLEQFAEKEESLWLEGKRFNLLDYEIQEIELEGGSIEEKRRFLDEFVEITLKLTDDEIRGMLLPLYSLNMKYGHVFDEQIVKLFDKLGIPRAEIHNHFDKDSHCQVFNSSVTGKFENK